VLGTSRGGHDTTRIVDAIEVRAVSNFSPHARLPSLLTDSACVKAAGVNQLYVIGGDGTMRGASLIAEEAKRRGLCLAVAGDALVA
jgi:6-phosphofructokinase